MLENIGKISLILKTIQRAVTLVGLIYGHSTTLSLLRFHTNTRELVRQALARFATFYLTLERLYNEKRNLRKMFVSDSWTKNKLSKEEKGIGATKTVLNEFFWKSVAYTLKVLS